MIYLPTELEHLQHQLRLLVKAAIVHESNLTWEMVGWLEDQIVNSYSIDQTIGWFFETVKVIKTNGNTNL